MVTKQQHQEILRKADALTNRKTLYAAGAGLIPFPIVDAVALLGIQMTMIQSIANLYKIEFKKHLTKSLIGSLLGSISGVALVKLIPGIGSTLGGAATSLTGAATTYAVGRVFTQHFDQGGTLLDFDPSASREYFQKELEASGLFLAQQDIVLEEDAIANETTTNGSSLPNNTTANISTKVDTEKALLIEETNQLYKALEQLQEAMSTIQLEEIME